MNIYQLIYDDGETKRVEQKNGFVGIVADTCDHKYAYRVAEFMVRYAQVEETLTLVKVGRVNTRPKGKARAMFRKAARKGKQYLRDLTPMGYELVTE